MGLLQRLVVAVLGSVILTAAAAPPAPEQEPGTQIRIDPQTLVAPGATKSSAKPPQQIKDPTDTALRVPRGFEVNVFAEKVTHARNMAVAPNGDVFVVQQSQNKIALLQDDGGKAKSVIVFAEGFRNPYGIALTKDAMLVGDIEGVWRISYTVGDTKAREKQVRITAEGALADGAGHSTRNVIVSPDGTKLYVAIGSRGNIGEDAEPRATIQEFALDGSKQRTFASGLRNPVGLAFAPGTSDLYTVVNERDALGDELVPDYLTKVADGGFYGWPYSYIGKNPEPNPSVKGKRPDLVAKAIVPDVLFRSHSAPIGIAFATGTQFPAEYRGGVFVALHGSWNAAAPRGYMVAYVPFNNGKPVNSYTVFASGFWKEGTDQARVWGRPSGVAVAKDGSLLIADDTSGTIFRVSYTGK